MSKSNKLIERHITGRANYMSRYVKMVTGHKAFSDEPKAFSDTEDINDDISRLFIIPASGTIRDVNNFVNKLRMTDEITISNIICNLRDKKRPEGRGLKFDGWTAVPGLKSSERINIELNDLNHMLNLIRSVEIYGYEDIKGMEELKHNIERAVYRDIKHACTKFDSSEKITDREFEDEAFIISCTDRYITLVLFTTLWWSVKYKGCENYSVEKNDMNSMEKVLDRRIDIETLRGTVDSTYKLMTANKSSGYTDELDITALDTSIAFVESIVEIINKHSDILNTLLPMAVAGKTILGMDAVTNYDAGGKFLTSISQGTRKMFVAVARNIWMLHRHSLQSVACPEINRILPAKIWIDDYGEISLGIPEVYTEYQVVNTTSKAVNVWYGGDKNEKRQVFVELDNVPEYLMNGEDAETADAFNREGVRIHAERGESSEGMAYQLSWLRYILWNRMNRISTNRYYTSGKVETVSSDTINTLARDQKAWVSAKCACSGLLFGCEASMVRFGIDDNNHLIGFLPNTETEPLIYGDAVKEATYRILGTATNQLTPDIDSLYRAVTDFSKALEIEEAIPSDWRKDAQSREGVQTSISQIGLRCTREYMSIVKIASAIDKWLGTDVTDVIQHGPEFQFSDAVNMAACNEINAENASRELHGIILIKGLVHIVIGEALSNKDNPLENVDLRAESDQLDKKVKALRKRLAEKVKEKREEQLKEQAELRRARIEQERQARERELEEKQRLEEQARQERERIEAEKKAREAEEKAREAARKAQEEKELAELQAEIDKMEEEERRAKEEEERRAREEEERARAERMLIEQKIAAEAYEANLVHRQLQKENNKQKFRDIVNGKKVIRNIGHENSDKPYLSLFEASKMYPDELPWKSVAKLKEDMMNALECDCDVAEIVEDIIEDAYILHLDDIEDPITGETIKAKKRTNGVGHRTGKEQLVKKYGTTEKSYDAWINAGYRPRVATGVAPSVLKYLAKKFNADYCIYNLDGTYSMFKNDFVVVVDNETIKAVLKTGGKK